MECAFRPKVKNPRRIVLLGPPASGKGTQGEILSKVLGVPTISAGALLRKAAEEKTIEGREIKRMVDNGILVPDKYIVRIMAKQLLAHKDGVILDGFPRTLSQAKVFHRILETNKFKDAGAKIDMALDIQVPDEYVIERVVGRFVCATCGATYHEKFKKPRKKGVCDVCGGKKFTKRADDSCEKVISRLRNYRSETAPVLPFYEDKGLLVCIDGTGPIDVVSKKIKKMVGY